MDKIKFIKIKDNKKMFDGTGHGYLYASTDKGLSCLNATNLHNIAEELQDKNSKTKHNNLLSIFKYIKHKMKLN